MESVVPNRDVENTHGGAKDFGSDCRTGLRNHSHRTGLGSSGTDSRVIALWRPYDRGRWGTKSCTTGTDSRVYAPWMPRDSGVTTLLEDSLTDRESEEGEKSFAFCHSVDNCVSIFQVTDALALVRCHCRYGATSPASQIIEK